MSTDNTREESSWDAWIHEGPNHSSWSSTEAEAALQTFRDTIDATLASLLKAHSALVTEYGGHTGRDVTGVLYATLFRKLQNLMVEIGRQALMSVYGGGIDRQTLPRPSTPDEVNDVLHEAMELY